MPHMQFRTFFGIRFIQSSYEDCLRNIEKRLIEGTKTLIVTPNPEILYDAQSDSVLDAILKKSDIAIPDGVGVFVGYQITDSRLPQWMKYGMMPFWCLRAIIHSASFTKKYGERITGSRLTPDILALAAEHHIGVTILDPVVKGSALGDILKRSSQENMQHILEKKYPWIQCNVIISDWSDLAHQSINPIIIATHGNKQQEKIVDTLLTTNPAVLLGIGVGSSIDLLTGFRIPAPQFFRRFGGEWLYRLYKNPQKHSKRILRVLRFLQLCFQNKHP